MFGRAQLMELFQSCLLGYLVFIMQPAHYLPSHCIVATKDQIKMSGLA